MGSFPRQQGRTTTSESCPPSTGSS
ncbi:26S protease regulatory subunit [Theileria orientalis strain Shintoku]|uniref:26S protease regulatory subunit n=1 Tax=Theileria orientalis strain Shintoku TaxID=869250 RepID=J7M4S9_THEOR|nr:26S protease regulatory subunit [Theileria orientalis strain Shintoku]BAM42485.1 26S protease regulatory subunit [Theileria orientalis strain Shintoku]|eukprot:XP_009692786.1 26S protease regulatory subunit [Theileria orientalis strain Shintoku]